MLGTTPEAINLNVAPEAIAPVEVMAGPVGTPEPLSAYMAMPVRLKADPAALTAVNPKVSVPLPVLVKVCG